MCSFGDLKYSWVFLVMVIIDMGFYDLGGLKVPKMADGSDSKVSHHDPGLPPCLETFTHTAVIYQ